MAYGSERREHPRFILPSMYTTIAVRTLESNTFNHTGHAYDLSEGGMRFELDQPVEPGQPIAVRIVLPFANTSPWLDRRPIHAMGNLVWVSEDDLEVPGPVRMACTFTRFMQPGDAQRIARRLNSGRYALAA